MHNENDGVELEIPHSYNEMTMVNDADYQQIVGSLLQLLNGDVILVRYLSQHLTQRHGEKGGDATVVVGKLGLIGSVITKKLFANAKCTKK